LAGYYRGQRLGLLPALQQFILGIIFYCVLMPFGLVIKLFGKDLLTRKLDYTLLTYRIVNSEEIETSMKNPF